MTAELRSAKAERQRLVAERDHIVEAIAADGGAPALTQKLAELDAALAELAGCVTEARAQQATLKDLVIDENDLRAALASFMPIWDALFPKERARILNLLIEVARVNVPTGEVEIVLRPEGIRLLAHAETKEIP